MPFVRTIRSCLLGGACWLACLTGAAAQEAASWRTDEIPIRDPFVFADKTTQTYYLYGTNREETPFPEGREALRMYKSRDLKNWTGPYPIYQIPSDSWANPHHRIWAPELHHYRGRYYLIATLTNDSVRVGTDANRPPMVKRGCQIFRADSPEGPFEPFDNRSVTPPLWMALDGTLWVEKGKPYLIFCHEWIQTFDGTVEAVRLKKDLSQAVGRPETLFRASEAAWIVPHADPLTGGHVTDGCFLYRTRAGKLLMLWSSHSPSGYAVGIAESVSGRVKGPWRQRPEPLFARDGGHGMLFRTFDGRLLLALHRPNNGETPHCRFFELEDRGDSLRLKGAWIPE